MADIYYDAVAEFMRAFGQEVRTTPTTDITKSERLLRARLVFEEAMEFVEAMGCTFNHLLGYVEINPDAEIDLVAAADATADLKVVVFGSDATLGIPALDVFLEVHRSNMAKLGADGKPILREGDRKVLKPEGWQPPDIESELVAAGWERPLALT